MFNYSPTAFKLFIWLLWLSTLRSSPVPLFCSERQILCNECDCFRTEYWFYLWINLILHNQYSIQKLGLLQITMLHQRSCHFSIQVSRTQSNRNMQYTLNTILHQLDSHQNLPRRNTYHGSYPWQPSKVVQDWTRLISVIISRFSHCRCRVVQRVLCTYLMQSSTPLLVHIQNQ